MSWLDVTLAILFVWVAIDVAAASTLAAVAGRRERRERTRA
jgi:hypothetical protein